MKAQLRHGNQKAPHGFSDHAAVPANARNGTEDAEVVMRTRFLLMAPVLVSIAGCSEKIEAQENVSEPSEIGLPPERTDTAEKTEDKEADLKLRSPVGLD